MFVSLTQVCAVYVVNNTCSIIHERHVVKDIDDSEKVMRNNECYEGDIYPSPWTGR